MPRRREAQTPESISAPCGDFYPDGSWNHRAKRRGPLFAFVAELCRACRAAPLAIMPAVAARRILDSSWARAFPYREQWRGIESRPYAWLEAHCGNTAESAIKAAACWWLDSSRPEPLGLPPGGPPGAGDLEALWARLAKSGPQRVAPLPRSAWAESEEDEAPSLWTDEEFERRRAAALEQIRSAGE